MVTTPWKVLKVRHLVSLPEDPVKLHLDSWAVKKLFSLAIRRAGKDKDADDVPQRKVGECTSATYFDE